MSNLTSDGARRRCERHVAELRRRIDKLKDCGAGSPLVTVDFVAEVEKTLDDWEYYHEMLRKDDCRGD